MLLFVFAGAPTGLLLGLGLGLSVLLLGLYLLREQHRPLVVPFAALWRRTLEKRRQALPWRRLRRLFSLLLQLTLLALLLLALGEPRSEETEARGRTVVFLVDVSPSMSAPGSGGVATRLDEAKKVLSSWIDALGERDRALIVSLSTRPLVETSWTNDPKALRAAATRLAIRHSAVDLPRALELARDVLPRGRPAEVILIGDGAYPPLTRADAAGLTLTFEPVGSPAPAAAAAENIGISNFSARRYPDDPRRFEAQLELSSTAASPTEVEIVLSALDPTSSTESESVIEIQRALIPESGRLVLPLPSLGGVTAGLVAQVRRVDGGSDWLSTDNRAQLLLRALPPLRVAVVGPANQFVDAALLTEPDVVTTRITDQQPPGPEPFDIVIYDGPASGRQPARAAIHLGTAEAMASFPVRQGRALRMFGFDRWKKDSPLFAAVDPYDVQILAGHALVPAAGDTALAFSGQDPIVVMGERPEGRFLALGFDPKQSDFFLRAAWPLFLHNALWELAPRASGEDGIAFVPGREWHLRTPGQDKTATIVGPLGSQAPPSRRVAVTEQRTALFGDLAGFYRIEQGDQRADFFANYFDAEEARLQPSPTLLVTAEPPDGAQAEVTGQTAATTAGATTLARPRPFKQQADLAPWLLLLVGALALSFSEWWTYHRRWTV